MRVPFSGICGEKFTYHRFSRKGRQSYRSYEFLGIRSHHDLHFSSSFYQQPDESRYLKGGDSSRYSYDYVLPFQHILAHLVLLAASILNLIVAKASFVFC